MKLFILALAAGNYGYAYLFDASYLQAFERSFFQAVALLLWSIGSNEVAQ